MSDKTTTDTLAEIEGQAEQPQPVQAPQVEESWPQLHPWLRTPPEQQPDRIITPDDVAAEALAGVNEWPSVQILRRKLETTEAALLEQQQRNEQLVTQGSQQRMQIAELQAQVKFLKNRELTLGTRLEEEKAVTTKRLQQVEELRSEVHYRQQLLTDERRRVEELAQKLAESQPQPVHQQAMMDAQAETIARLNSEIHGLNMEIGGLQAQLEAVKSELVTQAETSRRLQIELDAYELRSHNVSDRFEEGWDKGTAQAVETIAEWLEPIKAAIDAADNQDELARSGFFAIDTIRHLPHIMRSLTGLTDED